MLTADPLFPTGHANTFFNPQFSLLYPGAPGGYANYNAMEVTLQASLTHGLQFDLIRPVPNPSIFPWTPSAIGTLSGSGLPNY